MNAELIQDEGHSNPMSAAQLEDRMRSWLSTEYNAVLFDYDGAVVAYALYRDNEGRGVYLRQFFVAREWRRRGVGRAAFSLLVNEVVPGARVSLDVLVGNARGIQFWRAVGFTDYALAMERRPDASG
jgi:GNAT superfamily N-acetyltransferase